MPRIVLTVTFGPDGRLLASASSDGAVRLWDVTGGGDPAPVGRPLVGFRGYAYSAAFSPDGRTLAAASADSHDGSARRPACPSAGRTGTVTCRVSCIRRHAADAALSGGFDQHPVREQVSWSRTEEKSEQTHRRQGGRTGCRIRSSVLGKHFTIKAVNSRPAPFVRQSMTLSSHRPWCTAGAWQRHHAKHPDWGRIRQINVALRRGPPLACALRDRFTGQ
ncbi:WD40 repeat domain-containing protein [Micromonospora sp. HUAS LYJ1]|uniref:WD40 repeat domain-containing protein n=1 Tax=Micromonospora sp. HUAS LYJ1 TaxID=3061626 RepID=UPI002672C4B4|nr:hypothetical protein [Micromonospora sp. HUAS LYJ1]WKU04457.1 hypothetical protein Q2K16_27215 [Micromonospora sp. HUAS LYJ1]